jgi:type IV secretion system protein VirB1
MTIFTSAAVLAMITNPACGGVPAISDLAPQLQGTVMTESVGDQYAIGVNADPGRGLPAAKETANTAGEAINKAAGLIAQGRNIDLGLSQINIGQLHGLTIAEAFEECANLRAGAAHLDADHSWVLAHRRYNCGRIDCGEAYARQVTSRINLNLSAGTTQAQPPPLCAPAWDAWALATCSRGQPNRATGASAAIPKERLP